MIVRSALFVAVAWFLGGAPAIAQTVATGQFSGLVTDLTGGVLPGVRVTVNGPGLREQAITDESGRFTLSGLVQGPPVTYTVTAELVGFVTATLDKISAEAGGDVSLSFRLSAACLEEVDYVDFGVAEQLRSADSVLLLRINSATRARNRTPNGNCSHPTEYEATVVELVKHWHAEVPLTVRFVAADKRSKYDDGAEYIAFLMWDASGGGETYYVSNPDYMVPVHAGWLEWPFNGLGISSSGPISAVLEALRSLNAQH